MKKRMINVLLAVLLALLSCSLISVVMGKYTTKIELNDFNLNITPSFSGIVTTEEDLAKAKELGVDYDVQGGDYTSQILADGVTVTVDGNATVNHLNPISIKNGGTMVIHDATVIGSDSTPPTIGVYSGSTLNINGGTFSGWVLLMGASNCTVNIYGGTFDVEVINGYGGMNISKVGTVNIYGGTFSVDPSDYVAEGYTAIQNSDDTWTVQAAS